MTSCEQLEGVARRQRLVIQNHRQRLETLGKRWRDRHTTELDTVASALVYGVGMHACLQTPMNPPQHWSLRL